VIPITAPTVRGCAGIHLACRAMVKINKSIGRPLLVNVVATDQLSWMLQERAGRRTFTTFVKSSWDRRFTTKFAPKQTTSAWAGELRAHPYKNAKCTASLHPKTRSA